MVKNPPANAGDMGSIPGLERSPGTGNGNPRLPEESHRQRSLVGYGLRAGLCHKELDTTEAIRHAHS